MGRRTLGLALASLALVAPASASAKQLAPKAAAPAKVLVVTSTQDALSTAGSERHQPGRERRRLHRRRARARRRRREVHRRGARRLPRGRVPEHGQASPLTDAQRAIYETYFKKGGGFVGIGSAIETDPNWSFLTGVLGTRSSGRTTVQTGTVKVFDRVHDASKNLPEYWDRTDAFYNFTDQRPRALAHPRDGRRGSVRAPARRQHAQGHHRRHDGRQPPGRPSARTTWAGARSTRRSATRPRASTPTWSSTCAARSTGPRARATRSTATAARRCARTTSRRRSPRRRTWPSRSASTSSRTAASSRPPARARCACTTRPRARRRCIANFARPEPADDDADLHQPGGRPLRRRGRQRLRHRPLGLPLLLAADRPERQAVDGRRSSRRPRRTRTRPTRPRR